MGHSLMTDKCLYPILLAKIQWIKDEVNTLDTSGIISDHYIPQGSPVLVVRKKDSGQCMVINHRSLNRVTYITKYPLSLIEKWSRTFKGNSIFSVIDLTLGYHHVSIKREIKPKTAFDVPGMEKIQLTQCFLFLVMLWRNFKPLWSRCLAI